MDVAPYNEQYMIDLLAHFKWYLKSSTPVKTKDTHLEERGDKIYSVTETEDYIHLVFERDLGDPNIQRIKALEWEYFSIVIPSVPGYGGPIFVALIGLATGPFVILIWGLCIWWSMNISKRREIAQEEIPKLRARQIEILEECDSLIGTPRHPGPAHPYRDGREGEGAITNYRSRLKRTSELSLRPSESTTVMRASPSPLGR
jgi:hypothetical protein